MQRRINKLENYSFDIQFPYAYITLYYILKAVSIIIFFSLPVYKKCFHFNFIELEYYHAPQVT